MTTKLHKALTRASPTTLEVENPQGVPTTIYATEEVQVENSAVVELLNFLEVATDIGEEGVLERVVVTPDFHKGAGIPVGTVAELHGVVLPQAIGNDVGCGVSLLTTDLNRRSIERFWPVLATRLRYLFFEGGRDIALSPNQREAMLLLGPSGLHQTFKENATKGLWRFYDPDQQGRDLNKWYGTDTAHNTSLFSDYVKGSGGSSSRDAQIGSVGGGNHFVELQAVEEIVDTATARAWGLKPDQLVVMTHSGSVSLGHVVGSHYVDNAKRAWPKGVAKPRSGFYMLSGEQKEKYLDAMQTAVNFASCNRLCLGLMVVRALGEILRHKIGTSLVWDSPHNWINSDPFKAARHRKGACPALPNSPVLIPGSMGDSSFVLKGLGNSGSLSSACHGAGRQLRRGKASAVKGPAPVTLRVVTPVDPNSPQLRGRDDILKKYWQHLAEEAPGAYKPVLPIIDTVTSAGIAEVVARLKPLLTIKG